MIVCKCQEDEQKAFNREVQQSVGDFAVYIIL